jgi:IclR family transcriptional regulator, acetate operon repressor
MGTCCHPDGAEGPLRRAFRLLAAFSAAHPELTLGELVDATGIPRSTTHRMARQLELVGALERTARGWRVGVRLFELGQLVANQRGLRERALPYMNDLHGATQQTIHLAVLDGNEVLYVELISGHVKVRTPSRRGGRMPAHCTAVGKVLLAFEAGETPRLDAPLERRTPRTIVEPQRLRQILHQVRRTALAYDHEEALDGLCCVAAPVFGPRRRLVAALSVSMSAEGPVTPERAAPVLRMAASALSRELASAPP